MASLLQDEWRGLAHFRTESRRRVFKKTPAERTASELYVLEEVFSDVKLISNLPFSKRLEICKFIHYQDVDENKVVYREGELGDMFYVIFTGSVKVTATFGRKQKLLNTLYAGDYFGEAAFIHEYNIRRETVTTLRRCELLTLSKGDYERVLKTDITEEVRANFNALTNVKMLQKIPRAGLYRLASLLTGRSFAKNKVITFQGEEAREMYFIKRGECRVVMQVNIPVDSSPRLLPRAASSLSQYRPTRHDHCKQAIKDIQKAWGHPHLLARPLSWPSSRSHSVPPISLTPLSSYESSVLASVVDRPSSAPESQSFQDEDECPAFEFYNTGPALRLTPKKRSSDPRRCHTAGDRVREDDAARGERQQLRFEGSVVQHNQPVQQLPNIRRQKSERHGEQVHPKQRHTLPRLPSMLRQGHAEQEDGAQHSKSMRLSRRSRPHSQMSLRSYRAKMKSISGKDYSLKSLLKEINHKFCDESIQDLEFSDKEALLWGMGTSDTGLLRGDVSDPVKYQNKFEVWAKKVISKEKKLLACDLAYESVSDTTLPSFRSADCCDSKVGTQAQIDPSLQSGTFLDVGGLHAGEFFGEIGLLNKNKRSANVLTVTEVEVLVLSNSDFCRRLDKDIVECLSANNYKKADFMQNQYNRTYRWALFKRRIMKDALLLKRERFPNRFYHDMTDAIRRKATVLL